MREGLSIHLNVDLTKDDCTKFCLGHIFIDPCRKLNGNYSLPASFDKSRF